MFAGGSGPSRKGWDCPTSTFPRDSAGWTQTERSARFRLQLHARRHPWLSPLTDACDSPLETAPELASDRREGGQIRTGHHGTVIRLLEQVLQDSRATRLEEEVNERTRPTSAS